MSNVLDPTALIRKIPSLLPETSKNISSPHDALALLAHSILTTLGFRREPTSTNVLWEDWNKNGPEDYSFQYKHEQSSLQFIIKISKMGARTLFNATALESDKIASFDIATDDFVSPSFYPHDTSVQDAPLIHGYISSNRVADFTFQFSLKIVQKLIPGLRKEGYTEVDDESSATPTNPTSSRDPQPSRPRPHIPPEAPDRNTHVPQPVFPHNPLEIGRRDLDPFPTNPFAPPSLFPRNDGDGMFLGPNHPIFGRERNAIPQHGPWGGDGFLPPLGAPPGARFDPVGPDFLPGHGQGPFGPGRRGPPGNGNMRGPDNDEFMPPGMGDMYM